MANRLVADEKFLVIKDHRPAAEHHYLVLFNGAARNFPPFRIANYNFKPPAAMFKRYLKFELLIHIFSPHGIM